VTGLRTSFSLEAMLRVLYDVSALGTAQVTGVGIYVRELFFHLKDEVGLELIPVLPLSRWKKRKLVQDWIGVKPSLLAKEAWRPSAGSQTIYHNPDFSLPWWMRLPSVVTVHDMVVFEKRFNAPKFYKRQMRKMQRSLSNPCLKGVLANSEFTRRELLRYFPFLSSKVDVTHLGVEHWLKKGPSIEMSPSSSEIDPIHSLEKKLSGSKFILFVGTLEIRKNVTMVIECYDKLRSQGFQEKLVLVGKDGFGAASIHEAVHASAWAQDIFTMGYLKDSELAWVYRQAELMFFPSLYEGFGFTPLEALLCGCPTVVSDRGALAEIVAPWAWVTSLEEVNKVVNLLADLLKRPKEKRFKIQNDLSSRIISTYSWAICAKKTAHQKALGSTF